MCGSMADIQSPTAEIRRGTSGYATMVHGRGCNPHRCTTTFANVEITSLWRHNSETIRDRQKRKPYRRMKSSELSNGENRALYDNFCKTGNYVIDDVIIWVQDGNCKKMAWENFSIRALYNITKNQHNPIKTVGWDSFLSPKPLKIQVFRGHQPQGSHSSIFQGTQLDPDM